MLTRLVRVAAFAILTTAACSAEDNSPRGRGTQAAASATNGPITSTHAMSEGLTRDVQESERELTALQDSVYALVGDTVAALLRDASTSWEQYRKRECDAIRLAFAGGSVAPVAQLECWVELTDDRRLFLGEEYDFVGLRRASPVRHAERRLLRPRQ